MIRVYSGPTIATVSNVKNALEANGIPFVLRNEFLTAAFLGQGITFWPEIWVTNAGDAERAQQIITEATETSASRREVWRCCRCGEDVDAVFGECWKCGAERNE